MRAWRPELPGVLEVFHAHFDHAYPMHAHEAWSLLLVDDGAVTYGLDHAAHSAQRGALTVLPPGVPHDGRPAPGCGAYIKRVLYLQADWLPTTLTGLAADHPTLASPAAADAVHRVHRALRMPGDLLAAEHWLLTARDAVAQHLRRPPRAAGDTPLARRLRQMLEDRLTETFTITEVAQALGTHPSHLTRAFTQAYGMPPHRYQVSLRIDRARQLLVQGYRPAQVAALTGFYDQAHLTRHFRAVLGTTPSAFAGRG